MTSPRLGKLVTLRAADVWQNEPHVFTPWLSENLPLLAEALQLGELELKGTEVPAGDFRLDILAEDDEGNAVLVENQFGPTDHKHLGQLISYVASQGRKATVVWVAERFKEDHRAAIDWLNASTIEDYDFFGVEIEALKIGDSDPAPFFNVIARPNNWARSVGNAARESGAGELIESHRIRLNYWALFAEFLRANDPTFAIRRPIRDHWVNFPIGKSGVSISATISTTKKRLGVHLYFHRDGLKSAIRQLAADKIAIEKEFGEPLDWQELPNKKASRIAIYRTGVDPSNSAQFEDLHRWMLDHMQRIRKVFGQRVKALKLDDQGMANEVDED